MVEKSFDRRSFLRSAGTVGLAGLGGIGATGTAAASSNLWIESHSNYWDYEFYTTLNSIGLEHGSESEPNQDIIGGGYSGDEGVNGEISEGGLDSFKMDAQDDSFGYLRTVYNDFSGYIKIEDHNGSGTGSRWLSVERDNNPDAPNYDYAVEIDGQADHRHLSEPGQDKIDGNRIEGTVNPGGEDTYTIYGDVIRVEIWDPASSYNIGLLADIPY